MAAKMFSMLGSGKCIAIRLFELCISKIIINYDVLKTKLFKCAIAMFEQGDHQSKPFSIDTNLKIIDEDFFNVSCGELMG